MGGRGVKRSHAYGLHRRRREKRGTRRHDNTRGVVQVLSAANSRSGLAVSWPQLEKQTANEKGQQLHGDVPRATATPRSPPFLSSLDFFFRLPTPNPHQPHQLDSVRIASARRSSAASKGSCRGSPGWRLQLASTCRPVRWARRCARDCAKSSSAASRSSVEETGRASYLVMAATQSDPSGGLAVAGPAHTKQQPSPTIICGVWWGRDGA